MQSAKDELLALVPQIKVSSLNARKRLAHSSKNPRHVNASPKNNISPATVLRKTLLSMFNNQFQGSRTALMKGLCGLYRPKHSKRFNGFLSSNDLKSILSSVPPSRKTGKYRAKNMLEEIAIDTYKSSLKTGTKKVIHLLWKISWDIASLNSWRAIYLELLLRNPLVQCRSNTIWSYLQFFWQGEPLLVTNLTLVVLRKFSDFVITGYSYHTIGTCMAMDAK